MKAPIRWGILGCGDVCEVKSGPGLQKADGSELVAVMRRDGAKAADLGSPGPGRLVVDFNFAYHPSCAWDARWTCPLAPPGNRLDIEVRAGERIRA